MAEPYLGEIRLFTFNFAPKSWAFCNGQLLPINQNQALFSLLGTAFGGDGRTTFALPDFRGRLPIHCGDAYFPGTRGGENTHTLTLAEMPQHNHDVRVSDTYGAAKYAGGTAFLAGEPGGAYAPSLGTPVALNPATVADLGGGQPHENRQPFLALNFCIALGGIYPSSN